MSQIGHVFLLSDARIDALLADPTSVFAVVDGAYNEPGAGFVDLDKAWHCLHVLMTGEIGPSKSVLGFLLSGGAPVGSEDVGHGPARAFRPIEVAAIADAIAPFDQTKLLARFDRDRLERFKVYPGGWKQLNLHSDYEIGYYVGPFKELQRVLARAKAEGSGMLVWLS